MSFNDCLQKSTDLLAKYEHMISLSNDSALNNHAKTSEEVYRGLLNILYPSRNYQRAERINEKGIDLFDPESKDAVQIKSKLGKSGIRECVEKFSTTEWCQSKGYNLVILVTAEKCGVPEQDFEVDNYGYTNHSGSYLDNNRLLNLVSVENCQRVLEHLEEATASPNQQSNEYSPKFETVTNNNSGVMIQISGSENVSFDGANFGLSADNREVTLTQTDNFQSALGSYEKGLYDDSASKFNKLISASPETDINNSLYYVLSKVSGINIYELTEVVVEKINRNIQHLFNTDYEELGNILWLIVYFENVATRAPSGSIESLMHRKLSGLDYLLPSEHKSALSKIETYTPESQEILRKIRYEN